MSGHINVPIADLRTPVVKRMNVMEIETIRKLVRNNTHFHAMSREVKSGSDY